MKVPEFSLNNPHALVQVAQAVQAATRTGARRVIGPIPPRGKDGKLLLKEYKDRDGNFLARDPREYLAYEHGHEPAEGSTKGLKLYQVDLKPEPITLLYAKDESDAVRVYKAEMGITRFGENDPKVTEVTGNVAA